MKLRICLAVMVGLLASASVSVGEVVYVDANAPGANDGSSWQDAYNELREALPTVADSNTRPVEVRVAQGTYRPDKRTRIRPLDRGAAFQLINDVTLKGGYAGFGRPDPNARDINRYETILSGDIDDNDSVIESAYSLLFDPNRGENSYNAVTSSGTSETAVLDGFTVTGAARGGMMSFGGSPTVLNCTFTKNSADNDGGGMCSNDSSPTVINCVFSTNAAWDDGGGLYSYGGSMTVTNCTFSDNWAVEDGGGICLMDCSARFVNCLVGANIGGRGGGMSSRDGSAELINCTFADNSAGLSGAGLWSFRTNWVVANCILWDDPSNEISIWDETLEVTYSDIAGGWAGEGNIDADPQFFFAGDLHVSADSPCIDSGTNDPNGGLPVSDADGNSRVLDGDGNGTATVDMGAYEYNRTGATIVISDHLVILRIEVNEPNLQENVLVGNAGGVALDWELTESCPWLSASPAAGQLTGGGIDEVTLTADASGLELGCHTCDLVVSSPQAINGPQEITVVLYITRTLHVPGEYGLIQNAIDAATTGDIVLVADGVYTGDRNKNLDFAGKAITLASVNGAANCIIDCEHDGRGFYLHSGETAQTVIDGFTICRGSASIGAGMYNSGSSPTVKNCVFRDNEALSGIGGGMSNRSNNPIIVKCRFVGNRARSGGGIQNGVGEDRSCRPMLVGCVFTGNRARWGAGMSSSGSDGKCVARVVHCTFADNVASEAGGGLSNGGDDGECEVSIDNCIMWGNSPDEIDVGDSDVVAVHSDMQGGWQGQGNIDADPCFVLPGWWADVNDANTIVEPSDPNAVWVDGDYHLRWNSPCINAGDPNFPDDSNQTDIDGEPRVMAGRADIGADEVGPKQADLSRDGIINFEDLSILIHSFGSTPQDRAWYMLADLREDDRINCTDLAVLVDDWLWQAPWYQSP